MNVVVTPKALYGTVQAPPSKSYAQRLLLAAFLSGEKVELENVGGSADVRSMLTALAGLGAEYSFCGENLTLSRKNLCDGAVLDCGESAATLRFLLPVVCALGMRAEFTGKNRLPDRPVSALKEVLSEHGARFEGNAVGGKISGGVYRLRADISSQYISGLLFALPLLKTDSEILLSGERVSSGYVKMTLAVLKQFGVEIVKTENGYFIKGGQNYRSPEGLQVEGDYSSAAFLLAAGAVGGSVTVENLPENSLQEDKKTVEILRAFGADVLARKNSVTAKKGSLKGIEIDCKDIPDLVPVLSVVAAFAGGVTKLKNVERLRWKESDRIAGIEKMLQTAGIKTEYAQGGLSVFGGKPKGGSFKGDSDHRTVMAATVLSCFAEGTSCISDAEAVEKSYPAFWDDVKKLGGEANVKI